MENEPRAVGGAKARLSNAADSSEPSGNPPHTQRQPFAVIVTRGLWKGCDVTVEPPTSEHPMRHFRSHGEALVFAGQLAALNAWRLFDRCGLDKAKRRPA